jgi:hypothetical protein
MEDFKQGDKVRVRGCFSDFNRKQQHLWFEGEFLGMCQRYKWKYRVKVNGKYSDWEQCEKI